MTSSGARQQKIALMSDPTARITKVLGGSGYAALFRASWVCVVLAGLHALLSQCEVLVSAGLHVLCLCCEVLFFSELPVCAQRC